MIRNQIIHHRSLSRESSKSKSFSLKPKSLSRTELSKEKKMLCPIQKKVDQSSQSRNEASDINMNFKNFSIPNSDYFTPIDYKKHKKTKPVNRQKEMKMVRQLIILQSKHKIELENLKQSKDGKNKQQKIVPKNKRKRKITEVKAGSNEEAKQINTKKIVIRQFLKSEFYKNQFISNTQYTKYFGERYGIDTQSSMLSNNSKPSEACEDIPVQPLKSVKNLESKVVIIESSSYLGMNTKVPTNKDLKKEKKPIEHANQPEQRQYFQQQEEQNPSSMPSIYRGQVSKKQNSTLSNKIKKMNLIESKQFEKFQNQSSLNLETHTRKKSIVFQPKSHGQSEYQDDKSADVSLGFQSNLGARKKKISESQNISENISKLNKSKDPSKITSKIMQKATTSKLIKNQKSKIQKPQTQKLIKRPETFQERKFEDKKSSQISHFSNISQLNRSSIKKKKKIQQDHDDIEEINLTENIKKNLNESSSEYYQEYEEEEELKTIEKIQQYQEIINLFGGNIVEFDHSKDARWSLVNFYLYKRFLKERKKLEECLKGGENIFNNLQFLEIKDEDLLECRQTPQFQQILRILIQENIDVEKSLASIIKYCMKSVQNFPKSTLDLDQDFDNQMIQALKIEAENLKENIRTDNQKHYDRQRLIFLFESLFLILFLNGHEFIKEYQDFNHIVADFDKYYSEYKELYDDMLLEYEYEYKQESKE